MNKKIILSVILGLPAAGAMAQTGPSATLGLGPECSGKIRGNALRQLLTQVQPAGVDVPPPASGQAAAVDTSKQPQDCRSERCQRLLAARAAAQRLLDAAKAEPERNDAQKILDALDAEIKDLNSPVGSSGESATAGCSRP